MVCCGISRVKHFVTWPRCRLCSYRFYFPRKYVVFSHGCTCDTKSYFFGHFAYGLHAGAVEVVVVLARLDELVLLDVSLHLLSRHHEMVIAAVHFVVALRPRRIWDETTEQNGLKSQHVLAPHIIARKYWHPCCSGLNSTGAFNCYADLLQVCTMSSYRNKRQAF